MQEERLKTRIEEALELEEIDSTIFRSKTLWKPIGARGVFGGQIIAQALQAATNTVNPIFNIHSLHSYFLFQGDCDCPIVYTVSIIRDGRSFATRSVSASQKGSVIYISMCSFQVFEQSIIQHSIPMPIVSSPEETPTLVDRMMEWLEHPKLPPKFVKYLAQRIQEPVPIEFKPLQGHKLRDLTKPTKTLTQQMWIKAAGKLPDKLSFHHSVAAYCSDHYLLSTAQLPSGITYATDPAITMMASLDHVIWFHRPFRVDDWMLFSMETTRGTGGRGLAFGRLYTRQGELVLSCAQEGLIRTNAKL